VSDTRDEYDASDTDFGQSPCIVQHGEPKGTQENCRAHDEIGMEAQQVVLALREEFSGSPEVLAELNALYKEYLQSAASSERNEVVARVRDLVGEEAFSSALAVKQEIQTPSQFHGENGFVAVPPHTGVFDANVSGSSSEVASSNGNLAELRGPDPPLRTSTMMEEYEGDISGNEGVGTASSSKVKTLKGNLEVSEATLEAWNHCVQCNKGSLCKVELCADVRPYIVHLRKIRNEGIVGLCKESCKFCVFFDTMTQRIKPKEESLSRRKRKELVKEKRLVRQFTGLLLAHMDDISDPQMLNLYNHMMKCTLKECPFRTEHGSCRSSRELMMHLQDCKANKTKLCPLCSKLSPNVQRMKKRPRSLPRPAYVLERVNEIRKERQRQRRRERDAERRRGQMKRTEATTDAQHVDDLGAGNTIIGRDPMLDFVPKDFTPIEDYDDMFGLIDNVGDADGNFLMQNFKPCDFDSLTIQDCESTLGKRIHEDVCVPGNAAKRMKDF